VVNDEEGLKGQLGVNEAEFSTRIDWHHCGIVVRGGVYHCTSENLQDEREEAEDWVPRRLAELIYDADKAD
jgi:hypothetical protein